MSTINALWRSRVSKRCGGSEFDAPGGGYAFSDVLAEERLLSEQNKPGDPTSALLAFSVADPTGKIPPAAIAELNRYYNTYPGATRYTDNRGIVLKRDGVKEDTQDLLADWLNRQFGNNFNSDWAQYSPGAIKRALAEFIPTLLFDSRTKLFFPTPGYPVIKSDMNRYGAQVSDVPLQFKDGCWEFDLDEMARRCQCHIGQRVMYVNMPHNPTGGGYSHKQWEELLKWAGRYNIILIVDEAYTDLRYNNRTCSVLTVPGWENHCIVLQSISKGWNATGLRFGWIVAHPSIIKAIRKVTDVKDSGMFGGSIAAGLRCLHNPEWAQETCAQYQRLHTNLFEGLQAAGFETSMPEAGLCQFTPAPKSADNLAFANAQECAQWLRKKLRISIMHYTVNGNPWLRWAVTIQPVPECNLSNQGCVIEEAVRRLQQVEFGF